MWLFNSNKTEITSEEFDELFKYASYDGRCGMSVGPKVKTEYLNMYVIEEFKDGYKHIMFKCKDFWIMLYKDKDNIVHSYYDNLLIRPAKDKWTVAKNQKQYEIIKKVIGEWTEYLKSEVEKELKKIKKRPKFKKPKSSLEVVEQIIKGASIMDIDSAYIMWIDWKDDEKTIVEHFNNYFVNACINYNDAGNGDITIVKDEKEFSIKHSGNCSDIDKTLIAIQKCIENDYQVLYLIESDGDTLAFTVLTNDEWENIKKKYINEIEKYFKPITDDIKIFS